MRIEIDDQNDQPYNTKCVVETGKNSEENIWEIAQLLKQVLLGIGFHPESIDEIFVKEEENETDNS